MASSGESLSTAQRELEKEKLKLQKEQIKLERSKIELESQLLHIVEEKEKIKDEWFKIEKEKSEVEVLRQKLEKERREHEEKVAAWQKQVSWDKVDSEGKVHTNCLELQLSIVGHTGKRNSEKRERRSTDEKKSMLTLLHVY